MSHQAEVLRNTLPEGFEKVSGVREVWASLPELLPPPVAPGPTLVDEDETSKKTSWQKMS